MSDIPDILTPALRQFNHNDCSGLVFGFELEETIEIIDRMESKYHKALELLKVFVGDESMDMKLVQGHVEKAKILIKQEKQA